jgi:hypothetical protein
MENNTTVITMEQQETAYLKKCKHFVMLINYVREQVSLGLVEIRKILGTDNMADILTKKVRTKDFQSKAMRMLGEEESI